MAHPRVNFWFRCMGAALAGALAVLTLGAGAEAQAPIVIKYGTTVGEGNPTTEALREFARVAGEKSKGRLKVELYLNNQLAKGEASHLEALQLGTVDMTTSGSAPIGGIFEPTFQALDLPFLWSSRPQVWKVMDGPIGQELLKKLEAKGLKGLCFGGGWGFRNMMSNKRPVFTPDDMKGQTIRVQESPTYVGLMKALGANPVPMAFGELYLAMKQGTIDGMELPPSSVVSEKFHEVTKYYSLTQHSYSPIAHFIGLKRYQSLPADLQRVVDEAGRATCAAHRTAEIRLETAGLEFIKKAGVQVNEVKDPKAFQDKMGPVYEMVRAKVGGEFLDRLRAAARAAAQ